MSSKSADQPCYLLSIAVAGSAMGGVYSAGALDFILEALRELEKRGENGGADKPKWDIQLTDLVGTSSGGVTAALGLSLLSLDYEHLRADFDPNIHPPPENNILYDFWVKRAVPEVFLGTDDLKSKKSRSTKSKCCTRCFQQSEEDLSTPEAHDTRSKPVIRSVFFPDAMYSVAKASMEKQIIPSPNSETYKIPHFAKDIRLTMTHTNLNGIPYVERQTQVKKHPLMVRSHADHTTFDTNIEATGHDAYHVDLNAPRSEEQWKRVVDTMAATSAFPVVLGAKLLRNRKSFYEERFSTIPKWEDKTQSEESFYAIDGFFNTKPYDLAEKGLRSRRSSETGDKIESDPSSAWGSVLLIDAFPPSCLKELRKKENIGLVDTMIGTWTATRAQAGFKHELMARARDEEDLSTFLISPSEEEPALASKPLMNSASILHERMRVYDFMRGRYDAQRFLRDSFVISASAAAENPIFSTDGNDPVCIIPLVGSAAKQCKLPDIPNVPPKAVRSVKKLAKKRVRKLFNVAARETGLIQPTKWWNIKIITQNILAAIAINAGKQVVSTKLNDLLEQGVNGYLIESSSKTK